MTKHLNRRGFIKNIAGLGALLSSPAALARIGTPARRELALHNLHTGESTEVVYWRDGDYASSALTDLNHLLRDHRSGEVWEMDPALLDQLYVLQRSVGVERPYHVISGYRSPATNAMLSSRSNGVAKRSLHMQGRAIDVRLPGVKLSRLREAALALQAGGVGYYPKSNFIHLDTGRVRFW
ncbi:MAG: hypothetical protein CMN57_06730 [Gammaproteobacteria bacterium]|nr:hypothetical protein [Gammaproteobacteria bacterium]